MKDGSSLVGNLVATGGTPIFEFGSIRTGALTVSGVAGANLQFKSTAGKAITPAGLLSFQSGVTLIAPNITAGSTVELDGCTVQTGATFPYDGTLTISTFRVLDLVSH
jgi:hypothetical protein